MNDFLPHQGNMSNKPLPKSASVAQKSSTTSSQPSQPLYLLTPSSSVPTPLNIVGAPKAHPIPSSAPASGNNAALHQREISPPVQEFANLSMHSNGNHHHHQPQHQHHHNGHQNYHNLHHHQYQQQQHHAMMNHPHQYHPQQQSQHHMQAVMENGNVAHHNGHYQQQQHHYGNKMMHLPQNAQQHHFQSLQQQQQHLHHQQQQQHYIQQQQPQHPSQQQHFGHHYQQHPNLIQYQQQQAAAAAHQQQQQQLLQHQQLIHQQHQQQHHQLALQQAPQPQPAQSSQVVTQQPSQAQQQVVQQAQQVVAAPVQQVVAQAAPVQQQAQQPSQQAEKAQPKPSISAISNIPSKVIHFRNVVPDIIQADLLNLCAPFGRVTHILLLKNAQALVQFADLQAAISFIQYYGSPSPKKHAVSSVSSAQNGSSNSLHQVEEEEEEDEDAAVAAALLEEEEVYNEDDELGVHNVVDVVEDIDDPEGLLASYANGGASDNKEKGNNHHHHLQHLQLQHHHHLLQPSAKSQNSGQQTQPPQQYIGKTQANIRGINVYPSFSSHQELSKGALNVNNVASAAVLHNLGVQEHEKKNRILLVTIYNVQFLVNVDVLYQVFNVYGPIEKIVMFNKTAGLQGLIQYKTVDDAVSAKTQLHGQCLYGHSCTLSIQYSNLQDLTVHQNSDRARDYTKPNLPTEANSFTSLFSQVPYSGPWFSNTPVAQQQFRDSDKTVLLVSNFTDKLDCDKIFNLFSCYGYIVRIKIFRSKSDHALVQMATNQQASTAIACLKGIELFGKKLSVNFSRHTHINASDASDHLTKDYTRTAANRFPMNVSLTNSKAAGNGAKEGNGSSSGANGSASTSPTSASSSSSASSPSSGSSSAAAAVAAAAAALASATGKKVRYMCHPTHTIHISNLEGNVEQKELTSMFSEFGEIEGLRIFDHNSKRMALIKYKTITCAAEALCTLHNSPVKGHAIKISFSTNKI